MTVRSTCESSGSICANASAGRYCVVADVGRCRRAVDDAAFSAPRCTLMPCSDAASLIMIALSFGPVNGAMPPFPAKLVYVVARSTISKPTSTTSRPASRPSMRARISSAALRPIAARSTRTVDSAGIGVLRELEVAEADDREIRREPRARARAPPRARRGRGGPSCRTPPSAARRCREAGRAPAVPASTSMAQEL